MRLLFDLTGHADYAGDATWTPDGCWIATSGFGGTARVWSMHPAGRTVLRGHAGRVITADWSPVLQRFVTTGQDRTMRFWHSEVW